MNEIDAVVIVIIAFHCFFGFRKGLIMATFNLVGIVGGIIVSNMYYQEFVQWLMKNTNWFESLQVGIRDNLLGAIPSSAPTTNSLMEAIKEVPIPEGMKLNFINSEIVQNTLTSNPDKISGVFVDWIATMLLNLVSMVLIFLAVIITVKIVGLIIDQIVKIPVLKEINQFGGLVFGLIKGALYVMVLILLVPPVSTLIPSLELMQRLNDSTVAIYFYNYNLVYMIFRLVLNV